MESDLVALLVWGLVGGGVSALMLLAIELATGNPFSFAFSGRQPPAMMPIAIAVRVVAGPAIVARAAQSRLAEGRDDGVVPVSMLLLAFVWCLATGWLITMPMMNLG